MLTSLAVHWRFAVKQQPHTNNNNTPTLEPLLVLHLFLPKLHSSCLPFRDMSIYQRLQREANHQAAEIQRMWDEEDDDDDDDLAQELLKRKRNTGPRKGGTNQKGRPDYWDSPWGIMLRDPNLQKVGSPERKAFTRRFRTPYPIYKRLVQWAKGWHEKKATDCTGRARCPTELKVLGYLRMTGRVACFDNVEELSFMNESTMHAFFHKFSVDLVYAPSPPAATSSFVPSPSTASSFSVAGSSIRLGLSASLAADPPITIALFRADRDLKQCNSYLRRSRKREKSEPEGRAFPGIRLIAFLTAMLSKLVMADFARIHSLYNFLFFSLLCARNFRLLASEVRNIFSVT
jgi:hypothetical protein